MSAQSEGDESPDPFNVQANAALLRYKVGQLEKANEARDRELEQLRREIHAIEERNEIRDRERAATERKQLLWGVTFLGGIVMSLATVIWNYRSIIVRGS